MISWLKSYSSYYKNNLRLAVPVIISHVGQTTVMMADNIMVGRLGAIELAAVSFAGAVYSIGMVFGMGFAIGATPLIGIAYGKKKIRKTASIFQHALILNILCTILCLFFMEIIRSYFGLLGQEIAVIEVAQPFYNIIVLSFIPQMIFFSAKQFAEGVGNTKIAMHITIICNILNVILNYLLIYGKFGFPELGIRGAAIATLISRIGMAVGFIIVFWFNPNFNKYLKFFNLKIFCWNDFKSLIVTSIPVSLQIGLEVLTFAFCSIMTGWINGYSLAANQIALTLTSFTFMIVLGVASATTIRVSHRLGEKNYIGIRKAGFASMHLALAFMLVTALCFILFRNQIPLLFVDNAEVVAIASQLLVIAGIFQLFDGLQAVSMAALRGLADTATPMVISFICYIILCLGSGYLMAFYFNMGAVGIWLGYVVGLGSAALTLSFRFHLKSKRYLMQNR
jgi:MATE family multidrug resistance protein